MKWIALTAMLLSPLPLLAASGDDNQKLVTKFWQADSSTLRSTAAAALIAASPDIGDLYQTLKAGPSYSAEEPRGVRESARITIDGARFPYVFVVPESYDPASSYPVEFMLHGGVSRPEWETGGGWWRRGYDSYKELEQITVVPAAWNDNFWWQDSQADNLRGILRSLKQHYNIDDNRVYLSGVSDGGTGAYFFAFKQPSDWAAFLPYIGHPGVLRNAQSGGGHALYFENLMGNALFIVNGENDPLYPASSLSPFIDILKESNINHQFTVIKGGGHNTNWLPEQASRIDAFKLANPREPLPEKLIWVADNEQRYNKLLWIRIDELSVAGRPGLLDMARQGNEFSVRAEGVAEFSLLLNPEEVNFNELITVTVNGATLFNGQVSQSAETLLLSAVENFDRSLLFTAELRLQVP